MENMLYNKFGVTLAVATGIMLATSGSTASVLAQQYTAPPQGTSNGTANNFSSSSNTTKLSNPNSAPVSKISDKGIYNVQLKWSSSLPNQSPSSLSKQGFTLELLFQNASSLVGTGGYPQRVVPVDSFNMTIYGNHGKVLWSKTNEPATAGKAVETVNFTKGYGGDITILINAIKSSVLKGTDSVKFTEKLG
ncbi:MAG: hypothetical protein WB562_12155 [Candidatus Sulfotelmatobacter sp.]|jgi:hypothetical protein